MLTGEAYRESLRDGRSVHLEGRRIVDVTAEPAFAPAITWLADTYDRHFSADTDTSGPYYEVPTSVDDLHQLAVRQRSWDISTIITSEALLMMLTASSRMRAQYPHYAEVAREYHCHARSADLRLAFAITDSKGHRGRSPAEQDDPDLYVRIVARSSDGVTIRGAKQHVSNCAVVHDIVVMPTKRMGPLEAEWAFAGVVPANADGVTIVATSHAPDDPERSPWSSRYGVHEALVAFDDVFVPNDRILLAGEVEHSATWAHALGMWERLGALAHTADTADILVGLGQLIAEQAGRERRPDVKRALGDLILYATTVRAGFEAAVARAETAPDGFVTPSELYTNAAKHFAACEFSKAVSRLHEISGRGVTSTPSLRDLANPATGALDAFDGSRNSASIAESIRLLDTIRDLTADAYGGWRAVTLLLGGGGLHAQRMVAAKHYDMERSCDLARAAAGIIADASSQRHATIPRETAR